VNAKLFEKTLMSRRSLAALLTFLVIVTAVWTGGAGYGDKKSADAWIEVAPGVWRTAELPAGYALIDGDTALLVGAPRDAAGLKAQGVDRVDAVLLHHHFRDTCAAARQFLAAGVPVRAAPGAAEWLTRANVAKYWQTSLPMRGSRGAYLVPAVGFDGIDFSLADQQTIAWHGWSLQVVAAPGSSHQQVAFGARRGSSGPRLLFCGDALAAAGKLWAPYTTDWDHWTDAGLTPAAQSLRKLAALQPTLLLPAHGEPIVKDAAIVLRRTADAVEEMAFLKSFERFTKQRLRQAPEYRFLAQEQVASNGSKPWTRISEHLFNTGNTYVLVSREDNAYLVIDPWDNSAKVGSHLQLPKLKQERRLGRLEVVMFSHAHFDHYDGIYSLHEREPGFQTWALDQVARPLAEPFLLRAPFLDRRPTKFDRLLKDGETAAWREYSFRFHHLPGQTEFTMGVETTIDGKRCFFTADNFFHQDQFSGSGGWMGLNRSYPLPYAASAQKVLNAAPEWVLAEHGGPFEFNAEDFRRRVLWGQTSAAAADAICPSGQHRHDWDPNRVHIEPLVQPAQPGALLKATLVADNPLPRNVKLTAVLAGRGEFVDQAWQLDVPAGGTLRREFSLQLTDKIPAGRQVFTLSVRESNRPDPSDAFLVVDVTP
jgi:glyoxylase-like metal-dependent hydrolase (beta-lactamase superfamily II)